MSWLYFPVYDVWFRHRGDHQQYGHALARDPRATLYSCGRTFFLSKQARLGWTVADRGTTSAVGCGSDVDVTKVLPCIIPLGSGDRAIGPPCPALLEQRVRLSSG
jgi:hypothetical protein